MMMMSFLFRRITIATLEVIEKAGLIYNKSVGKYEDFRNRAFDDLYRWASIPRHPDQTKIGNEETNNKNKQYG